MLLRLSLNSKSPKMASDLSILKIKIAPGRSRYGRKIVLLNTKKMQIELSHMKFIKYVHIFNLYVF